VIDPEIVGQVIPPRLLSCAVVTMLTLSACTSTLREPVVGPPTASGVAGATPAPSGGTPTAGMLTADEYRAELEEARGPVRDALKKLAGTGGLKTLGKQLDKTSTAVEGAVTRLAVLAPPAEVKLQHDNYVEALRRFGSAFGSAHQDAEAQKVCTGPAVLTRMEKAGELADVEEVAKTLTGYPAGVVSVKAPKQQNRRLPNGRYIRSEGRPGRAYLELNNGNSQDAVIVLVRGKTKAVTVYVRKKSKFRVQGVRDGSYKVYYTFGSDWDSKSRTFTRSCTFEQFGKSVRFKTTYTAGQIRWSDWTLTLHSVVGGTVVPKRIKPGDFPN
jgi:hypothetical protein